MMTLPPQAKIKVINVEHMAGLPFPAMLSFGINRNDQYLMKVCVGFQGTCVRHRCARESYKCCIYYFNTSRSRENVVCSV